MKLLNKIVDRILEAGLAISLTVVCLVTFAQVISRYIFSLPIPWSTDVIRITFIYTIFLGAAMGVRDKGHLNIDVLFSLLSPKLKKVVSIFINIVLFGFFTFILVYGIRFTSGGLSQRTPYLQLPMSVMYFAVPLCGFLMLFYLVQQIAEQVKTFNKQV